MGALAMSPYGRIAIIGFMICACVACIICSGTAWGYWKDSAGGAKTTTATKSELYSTGSFMCICCCGFFIAQTLGKI